MHSSKLPLTVWFWAAYLMATHSNGISALQLQRLLALGSYKSAWLLCAKPQEASPEAMQTIIYIAQRGKNENFRLAQLIDSPDR
jgi:hypothetical protein